MKKKEWVEICNETFLLEMKAIVIIVVCSLPVSNHSFEGNSYSAAPEAWKCS